MQGMSAPVNKGCITLYMQCDITRHVRMDRCIVYTTYTYVHILSETLVSLSPSLFNRTSTAVPYLFLVVGLSARIPCVSASPCCSPSVSSHARDTSRPFRLVRRCTSPATPPPRSVPSLSSGKKYRNIWYIHTNTRCDAFIGKALRQHGKVSVSQFMYHVVLTSNE